MVSSIDFLYNDTIEKFRDFLVGNDRKEKEGGHFSCRIKQKLSTME